MEKEKAPDGERVSNIEIAAKIYKTIEHSDFEDIMEIGEYLKILAVNLKA